MMMRLTHTSYIWITMLIFVVQISYAIVCQHPGPGRAVDDTQGCNVDCAAGADDCAHYHRTEIRSDADCPPGQRGFMCGTAANYDNAAAGRGCKDIRITHDNINTMSPERAKTLLGQSCAVEAKNDLRHLHACNVYNGRGTILKAGTRLGAAGTIDYFLSAAGTTQVYDRLCHGLDQTGADTQYALVLTAVQSGRTRSTQAKLQQLQVALPGGRRGAVHTQSVPAIVRAQKEYNNDYLMYEEALGNFETAEEELYLLREMLNRDERKLQKKRKRYHKY